MRIADDQLKRFILDSNLITKVDIAGGYLTEDDMRRVESYVLGIPFMSLKDIKIDFEILSLIPEPVARTHNIIAFKKNELTLEVAMLDTADLPAIDFIKKKVGLKILPRLTDTESMRGTRRP
jgi:type IV pilus assembly protein PilB